MRAGGEGDAVCQVSARARAHQTTRRPRGGRRAGGVGAAGEGAGSRARGFEALGGEGSGVGERGERAACGLARRVPSTRGRVGAREGAAASTEAHVEGERRRGWRRQKELQSGVCGGGALEEGGRKKTLLAVAGLTRRRRSRALVRTRPTPRGLAARFAAPARGLAARTRLAGCGSSGQASRCPPASERA